MSSARTSRPDFSDTFLFRTRAPDFLSSWWKWTSWSRTALYAFTGTLTNPKLIEPDQIALAMQGTYPVLRPETPRPLTPGECSRPQDLPSSRHRVVITPPGVRRIDQEVACRPEISSPTRSYASTPFPSTSSPRPATPPSR